MKNIDKKELREIIQSGHLNLLMGSGCSSTYLSTLKDIENRMNDDATRETAQKDYYKIINKSKAITKESLEESSIDKRKLAKAKADYDSFLSLWAEIISKRSLHIVNKQINIFTTNFDMFIEDSCERLNIQYNDGFSGRINPFFDVANFNKIQKYKSLQFDNTSDIPLINILKLHGSISWKSQGDKIMYSDGTHIEDKLEELSGEAFASKYNQIGVINPRAEKHLETVLHTTYAALLRKFTLELEKENSVLVIVGFSLSDKHICELLYGVMKSNPTLLVVYLSHSKYDEGSDPQHEKSNVNFYIHSPNEADSYHDFSKSTSYLREIVFPSANNSHETNR